MADVPIISIVNCPSDQIVTTPGTAKTLTSGAIPKAGTGNTLVDSIITESVNEVIVGGYLFASVSHIMQSDSTDQAIADVTAEQVITFNTDVHHFGITRTSSSRFTITKTGSYLITFSASVLSTLPGKQIAIWMKINGSNASDSSAYYTFKGANANNIMAVNFLYHFTAGDYFELFMWGDDTGVKLNAMSAVAANPGVTPAIPACPSIIMTANYVGKD